MSAARRRIASTGRSAALTVPYAASDANSSTTGPPIEQQRRQALQGGVASGERCSDHDDQPVPLEPDRGGQQANRIVVARLSAGALHEDRPSPRPIYLGPAEDGWAGLPSLDLRLEQPTPPCQHLGKARALRGEDAFDRLAQPELAGSDH